MEKEVFIEQLKSRTKLFAINIIALCDKLKSKKASSVITYQIVKSATSTGANYRAACRARSKKEFFSKICIVVEEIDETLYWLEIIHDADLITDQNQLNQLTKEAEELLKIMSKTKSSTYKSLNN